MRPNGSNDDVMLKRRERVARLRLQGLSIREIAVALTKGEDPMLNPDTLQPYDIATIHSDLKVMQKEWTKNAARDIEEFIAEELAKLTEIEKSAWAAKKLEIVLKAMDRRAKLKGLDKPSGLDLTSNGETLNIVAVTKMDVDKL